MVQAILLAFAEYAQPLILICWREACIREIAILHCASQPYRMVVEIELTSSDIYVAHTKLSFVHIITCSYRKLIHHWMELIPGKHRITEIESHFHVCAQCFLAIHDHSVVRAVERNGFCHYVIVVAWEETDSIVMVFKFHIHLCLAFLHVRHHTHTLNVKFLWTCLQLYASDYSVPVALRLVCYAM